MNQDKIEILTKTQELCNNLYNNNLLLTSTSEDNYISLKESLYSDVYSIITSLEKSFTIPSLIQTIKNTILTVFDNFDNVKVSTLYELIDKFILANSNFLAQEIQNELSTKQEYFIEPIAGILLNYTSNIPCSSSLILSIKFNIFLRISAAYPQESYTQLLNIITSNPEFLKETNMHPGYIYEPISVHTFESCPICGGKGHPYFNAFAFKMSDFLNHDIPFKLWMKCEKCTNLYTYQHPETTLKLSEISQNITPENSLYINTTTKSSSFTLSTWCNILNKLSHYTSGKKLLEVGIGTGELLAVALELGYTTSAVEIISSVAQKVSNMLAIPIWNGDFLNYKSENKYSIIIMGDVIEHVTSPKKALEKAYNLLDDDGVLWLSTPNYESSFSKLHKFTDPMWCEPHHITYFSLNGFMNLIKECNFKLLEYNVSNRYQGSMELILKKNI